ncbi:homoserine kinase [Paraglaciecola marina]|uniref:homoserine kinase n=1 Tax=Paraglaciecola marina TaxID=2500157 RepID=UPI00105DF79F|nr:homoserine kinase [Paraglaciecola marina]
MSDNSDLTHKSVVDILSTYGIQTINSFRLLSGGSANSNYLVKTSNKDYVLTISEQKSSDEASKLASLLEYLEDNNFPTSKIVKTTENEVISSWNAKPIMVKEYLDGDIVDDLSLPLLTSLGEQLASLHLLPAPDYLPKTLSYGVEKYDEIKVYAPESDFFSWLKETQAYIESFISEDLPYAMIHSDIFSDNIIVSKDGDTATIMDFEEATYYYRVFDLGMIMVGTCCGAAGLSFEKAKALLTGYQKSITLADCEVKALQAFTAYGAAATAFWRHQNFNYLNVDEKMKDHYKAMQNIAVEVLKIPNDEFQEKLAI